MTNPQIPSDGSARPPVIDSHVHFWDPHRLTHPWLRTVPPLNRAFTPSDLLECLPEPMETIFVEAGTPPARRPRKCGGCASWRVPGPGSAAPSHTCRWTTRSGALQSIREHAADPFVVGVRHDVQYHGDDFDADLASIAADPDTRAWWQLTDPCQEPWPDTGAGSTWSDLGEIWHLNEEPSA